MHLCTYRAAQIVFILSHGDLQHKLAFTDEQSLM
jgi:hypothetical protein